MKLIAAFMLTLAVFAGSFLNDSAKTPPAHIEKVTFAAGCFWGVQATFDRVPGVISTTAGYCGGDLSNPTYQQVCTGTTGYAESVRVTYDPAKVSYAQLLDAFWSCHDPTIKQPQPPEVGSSSRSIIFYSDEQQEKLANESLQEVDQSGVFKGPIATQILPAGKFWPAEEYHQRYLAKLGVEQSCHVGVVMVHTKLARQSQAK